MNRTEDMIIEELNKCDKESCQDCLAYVMPYKRNKPVCLGVLIFKYDKSLKNKIIELLGQY